uniref:Ig-like domain-containing protein n=1 Tax=Oryzias latipes TaxID=8090 RepID=A0A3B3H9V8_ORYLA
MRLLGSGGSSTTLPLRMLVILTLTILFCGSVDSCLYNPIFLYPPEIIGEYGRYAFLNCSSESLDYNDIFLTVKGQTIDKEPYKNYVGHLIKLDDWNIDAKCSVHINDTHKCYTDVDITVYKSPGVDLFVKRKDATGERMQWELQCDIFNVAPVQNLTVRWYKNDHLIRTNSFPGTTKAAVNESSLLRVNISREENAALFRCEAQLNMRSRSLPAAVSQTINISANEVPTARDVTTAHGSFNLTSEAETTPPPEFVEANTVSHRLNMPKPENFTGINCSATEDDESATLNYTLCVGDTTKAHPPEATCDTLKKALRITPPEMVVRYGDSVVLNCSVDDPELILVSWETDYGSHEEINPSTSTLTIKKVESWILKPICFAVSTNGFQCTWEPVITVYKTPDSVSVTAVDPGPMIEGKEYQLRCNIQSVAPVNKLRVKWYRGDECLHTDPKNSSLLKPQNETSFWTFPLERGDNGSTFRCEAELQLGPELSPRTSSAPYTVLVHYKPSFKRCPDRHTVVENTFRISQLQCETDGYPPPSVKWYHPSQKPTDLNKMLTRTDSGLYRASVSNSIGNYSIFVDITVEYPPSFNCKTRYEAKMNGELKTPCEPEGSPPPTITWLKNGAEVFSTRHLTKEHSGNYTLKATNKHGTAQHTFYLEILYPPEFNQGNTSEEIIPGQNMTLDCSAEGNPEPETHWNFTSAENLHMATVGRHKIMTITRATSTNAGHYICVASNKLGRVTRSVLLIEMGMYGDCLRGKHFGWLQSGLQMKNTIFM